MQYAIRPPKSPKGGLLTSVDKVAGKRDNATFYIRNAIYEMRGWLASGNKKYMGPEAQIYYKRGRASPDGGRNLYATKLSNKQGQRSLDQLSNLRGLCNSHTISKAEKNNMNLNKKPASLLKQAFRRQSVFHYGFTTNLSGFEPAN